MHSTIPVFAREQRCFPMSRTVHIPPWTRGGTVIVLMLAALAGAGCDQGGDHEPEGEDPPDGGTRPAMLPVRGDIQHVHDPVVAKEGHMYYLFSTGQGILIRCSDDFVSWQSCGGVLGSPPSWSQQTIGNVEDLWAPDVARFGDRYHLYYSASTFGSNRSAIGLATAPTLDQGNEAYAWTDRGMVIESHASDDYNAIDPNVVFDVEERPWLAFGSYWDGIKMVALDAETGQPATDTPELHALASRPDPSTDAIEAPFIFHRDGYYYLFVSFDRCCAGASSTYNIRVGRAEEITGPYVDGTGVSMLDGGGTLVMEGTDRWRGTGHNAIFQDAGTTYLVYHAYDAANEGIPTLRISPIEWVDGWPTVAQV